MRTLIIDNYDSFTYNLVDLVGQVNGERPIVVKNDQCTWRDLAEYDFDNILISPGPGSPLVSRDLGLSADAVRYAEVPLLGVCLGHQAIGALSGVEISRGPRPVHGETSAIHHLGEGIFQGIPSPFVAARYHSLVLQHPLPPHLKMTAWTPEGLIMGLGHRSRPQWGVQFHPESIISENGRRLMENFRDLTFRQGCASRQSVKVEPCRKVALSDDARPSARRAYWKKMPAISGDIIYRELFSDSPAAYWLDSSSAGSGRGEWSFLGDCSGPGDCSLRYFAFENRLEIATADRFMVSQESIFDALKHEIGSTPENAPPCPFVGGYVGCFGYEMRHECGSPAQGGALEPTALFLRSHRFIAINHLEQCMFVVAVDDAEHGDRAELWLSQTIGRLEAAADRSPLPAHRQPVSGHIHFQLDIPKSQYLEKIEECLDLIRSGETYQVCLTNEISCETTLDPFSLYSVLRVMNPAPFSAFLKVGEHAVLSSSPERFLQVSRSGAVETKPIKGTISRADDEDRDEVLRESLRRSVKDRAENVMIVDLLRNDLSKVCEVGSVTVPRLFAIESFATVHQLVSTIHGQLPADLDVIDIVRATFPGGSMTGAPKIRTMGFIEKLEGRARGFYSGALGWLGDDGASDLSIVIRTIVMSGGCLKIGVGGGIVARSDPESEYQEMLLKAQAPIAAIVKASGCEPDAYSLDGGEDDRRISRVGVTTGACAYPSAQRACRQ